MTTLNEIAYDFLELIRAELSDDEHINLRQVKYWIHNQRAVALRNELNRFRTIDENIIQDLGCVELEVGDATDCPGIELGCSVLRTKQTIPDTIELHNNTGITRVGPVNKADRPFSFVHYKRAIFSGNTRFTQSIIYAFELNDRIYLKFNTHNPYAACLTHINIRGVFEDPTEVAAFVDPNGQSCYSDDTKYPINKWMLDYIKTRIIAVNLQLATKPLADESNDADANLRQT